MKKLLLTSFVILCSILTQAQTTPSKLDFRFGMGSSLLGNGDMITLMVENEINYKLGNYFAASSAINFGKSDYGTGSSASFLQGGIGLHLSPLTNQKRNDLRVGIGANYFSASYSLKKTLSIKNYPEVTDYTVIENTNSYSWGIRYMLEDTYRISDKYMVGIKLFSDIYPNVDINSGILVKLGFQL